MKMKRENNDNDDNGPQDNKRNRRIEDQIRILIPSNIAGAIIGKGGQHIQKMRTQYKATVSVDDSQGPERTILIAADLESTMSIVTEMLKYFDVRDDEIDVRLLIHQSLAGCVIGKAGQKIKEIRDKIGCRILKVFSNTAPQSTDRVVQTVGKQEQVLDAIREVITLTRETPVKGPVMNYNPTNFDRMYADEYGGYGSGIGTTRPSRGGRGGGGGGGGGGGFRGGDRGGNRNNDRSRSGGRGGGGGGGDMNPFINPWANGGNNDGFGPNNGGFGGGNFGGNGGFGGNNFGNNGGGFGNGPNGGGFGGSGGFGGGNFGNSGGGGGGFGNNSMGGNNGGFGGGGGNFGNSGGGGGMGSGNFGGGPNNMGGNGPMGGGNSGGGGGSFGGMNSLNGSGGGGNNANNGNLPSGHDPKNSTQVTIPKDLAGAIIGKGGGRIRRIRNESGAYITIDEPLPGSTDRIITISGNPKQIQMAQYLLQQSVHENNGGGGGGGGGGRRNF